MPAIVLWWFSDSPPYGLINNELSNNYWGIIVDIAHKWRSFQFTFWDKGVYGGTSLFTSGLYTILNPTNLFSLFLSDDQFYLVKLIEPYFFGVLFMHVLLWKQYKLEFPICVFGSLLYMGAIFGRHTPMLQHPGFLLGIALFPLMVFLSNRYLTRNMYLSAALVGAVIGLMFAVGGVLMLPQLLIWWSIFFTLRIWTEKRQSSVGNMILKWLACLGFLWVVAVGLFGVQLIPTYEFVANETVSRIGHHPMNNFPLWRVPEGAPEITKTLAIVISRSIFTPGGISGYSIIALAFGMVLIIATRPRVIRSFRGYSNFPLMCLTTVIFFLTPVALGTITEYIPMLGQYLKYFSMFTFTYALHTLGFCLVLSLCFCLGNDKLALVLTSRSKKFSVLIVCLIAILVCYLLMPLIVEVVTHSSSLLVLFPEFLMRFKAVNLQTALVAMPVGLISLFFLLIRPKSGAITVISWAALVLLSFMTLTTSWNWYDKGRRVSDFCWSCPEHEYFREATGKFLWFFDGESPRYMGDNYSLIYGVNSTADYMPLDPARLELFFQEYKAARYSMNSPNYFPIDFVVTNKLIPLKWRDFELVVEGKEGNVYERVRPVDKVYFSRKMEIATLNELHNYFVSAFNHLDNGNWFIWDGDILEDMDTHVSRNMIVSGKLKSNLDQTGSDFAYYEDYRSNGSDNLRFKVTTQQETFVLVPEYYRKGWKIMVDGRETELFPVNYIFLGFKVPAGEHIVEARFTPPRLLTGAFVSVATILILLFLYWRFKSRYQFRKRVIAG